MDHFKDYYKILEVEPGASTLHIKKSWRRLIQIYHPDKQDGAAKRSTSFQEIQEAYETLTNPTKKQKYLEQRWLNKIYRGAVVEKPTTVEELYLACIQLENKLANLRYTRIDEDYFVQYILYLLTPRTTLQTATTSTTQTIDECIRLILNAIDSFSAKKQKLIISEIEKLPLIDATRLLQEFKKKKKIYWVLDQYQLFVVGIFTLLLAGLIASIAN